MKSLLIFVALLNVALAHQIRLKNNCRFTVWPGLLGHASKRTPLDGGFKMNSNSEKIFNVENGWQGRIWPRTGCDINGNCVTGGCGNRIQCNGLSGETPATLAEFKFDGNDGKDFYDISYVDGHNLPVKITPITGTFRRTTNSAYDCKPAGCSKDLNPGCPNNLAVISNGRRVGCKSACAKFNTDQYCCRGAYGTPQTCRPETWTRNYAATFKTACPSAYSYAYDDQTSTFTCKGNPTTGYIVTFCP